MGTIAARKANEIMQNVRRVLAMELMCACQAVDLRGDKGLGIGTVEAYDAVRDKVEKLCEDRPLYEDINRCERIIIDESLVQRVESKVGPLSF